MAYVVHTDGTRELRSEAEAEKLWLIKVGRANPQTPAQKAYVTLIRKTIQKVKLNYRTAPEDYIWSNLNDLIPQIISSWTVDRHGHPVRPATKEDEAIAIKYGLWSHGKPTPLVTGKGQLTLV